MANVNAIGKTVAATATPEVLGTAFQRFMGVVFFGGKGTAETNNTSTAFIQLRSLGADGSAGDWLSAMPVTAGGYSAGINHNTAGVKVMSADQFKIKVGTNGDGVVAIVAS